MAGEGREGVSKLIYCFNIKKKEPFMGMGRRAHPHPRRCHACASIPTRPPPFALSRPGLMRRVRRPFPHIGRRRGVLVPPCGVVDVPFGVVGGGRGAGGRGTTRDVVVVKGSGWCEE